MNLSIVVAAEALECCIWHRRTLIGVAVETRDDGEPVLWVTLTRITKAARRQIPSSFCGYEVRLRTLDELISEAP